MERDESMTTFSPFRWGQTPLTEAILFKHTKVASLIKRHERTLNMQGATSKVILRLF